LLVSLARPGRIGVAVSWELGEGPQIPSKRRCSTLLGNRSDEKTNPLRVGYGEFFPSDYSIDATLFFLNIDPDNTEVNYWIKKRISGGLLVEKFINYAGSAFFEGDFFGSILHRIGLGSIVVEFDGATIGFRRDIIDLGEPSFRRLVVCMEISNEWRRCWRYDRASVSRSYCSWRFWKFWADRVVI